MAVSGPDGLTCHRLMSYVVCLHSDLRVLTKCYRDIKINYHKLFEQARYLHLLNLLKYCLCFGSFLWRTRKIFRIWFLCDSDWKFSVIRLRHETNRIQDIFLWWQKCFVCTLSSFHIKGEMTWGRDCFVPYEVFTTQMIIPFILRISFVNLNQSAYSCRFAPINKRDI